MRIAVAILLPAFAAIAGAAVPAQADPYRWCAQYGGRGVTNCYFITLEQCRAAISGNGGFCAPNNFYDGRPVMGGDGGPGRARRRAAH